MEPSRICPYAQCNDIGDGTACEKALEQLSPEQATLQYCANRSGGRIVKNCEHCSETNPSLAQYCSLCGRPLSGGNSIHKDLPIHWHFQAPEVARVTPTRLPQPIAAGDLFISVHGAGILISSIRDGRLLMSSSLTDQPGLYSSPVLVKNRVYCMTANALLEICLQTGKSHIHDIPGLTPGKKSRPLHVPMGSRDLIVVGGTDGVLILDLHRLTDCGEALSRVPLTLAAEDSLLSPVLVAPTTVVLSSFRGTLCRIDFPDGSVERNTKKHFSFTRAKRRFFSAPAYIEVTRTVVVEWVDRKSRRRGFFRWNLLDGTRPFLDWFQGEPEYYDENDLDFLVFSPLVAGSYAISRSLVPNECHFVSSGSTKHVRIEGLGELDPVGSIVLSDQIISVDQNRVARFNCAPVDQTARVTNLPGDRGPGSMVVTRPAAHLGLLLIQQRSRLLGWEM